MLVEIQHRYSHQLLVLHVYMYHDLSVTVSALVQSFALHVSCLLFLSRNMFCVGPQLM